MNRIEFIPLIELATSKDKESENYPSGTSLTNKIEWGLYQQKELNKNYKNIPKEISDGIYQYRLFDIEIDDLESAINLHIGDTEIIESCSLFGGYAISVNGKIEIYPQCCGLLEEIEQWKKILNKNFEEFYLLECHPSPLIRKNENEIIINCKDENESFNPPTTKEIIILDYEETKNSLLKTIEELKIFELKLNKISHKFGIKNISDILIWGKRN